MTSARAAQLAQRLAALGEDTGPSAHAQRSTPGGKVLS